MLFAASHKLFADVAIARVREAAAAFVDYMDGQHKSELEEIKQTGIVSDELKKTLARATEEFRLAHPEFFADVK